MENNWHSLTSLFEQLGLPSSEPAIREFVDSHTPLPDGTALHEAPFWNNPQAAFLNEGTNQDADWAGVIDQLNIMLRQPN